MKMRKSYCGVLGYATVQSGGMVPNDELHGVITHMTTARM
jgi:hypothetical protein